MATGREYASGPRAARHGPLQLRALLEQALGRRAIVRAAPRPAADVEETFDSTDAISTLAGFTPGTSLSERIAKFVEWFRDWHGF